MTKSICSDNITIVIDFLCSSHLGRVVYLHAHVVVLNAVNNIMRFVRIILLTFLFLGRNPEDCENDMNLLFAKKLRANQQNVILAFLFSKLQLKVEAMTH